MANKPVCKFYAKGNCKYGNSCKFAHVKDTGSSTGSNTLSNFISASNLGNKTAELKDGLKDYRSFQCKPVLSSFGLGYPAVNNLISGRDFSFEEQRLLYLQALASNNVEDYNRSMEARAKDMDSCVDYLLGKEQHATRYQQKSAEPNAGIPKPFIPVSLEENLTRIMNDPTGSASSTIRESGSSWSPSVGSGNFGGTGFQGSNPFSSTMTSSPFASAQNNQAGSLGSLTTNASLNNKSSGQAGFGQSGFGQSGFGQSGFGQSGFGQSGFGQSGFGNSGFGQSGFGNSGVGNPNVGQSGLGQSEFGKSGFGQSGFGNSGFGKLGFGQSGFRSSGFGELGFGPSDSEQVSTIQTNSPASGFGSSGFGKLGFGQSGFGKSGFGQSDFGRSGFGQPSSGESGFGQSGFGKSGFSQPPSGQSGFGLSGFGLSGFGKASSDLSKLVPTSSGFGSSGFPLSQTGPIASGFGQSGFELTSNESSGFGQFANKSEPNRPSLESSTGTGFGQSGFSKFSSEKPTFGNSALGNSASSPFLSFSNIGSSMGKQDPSSLAASGQHSSLQQSAFGGTSLETSNKPLAFNNFSNQSPFGDSFSKPSGAVYSVGNRLQENSQVDLKDYDERVSKAFAAAEFQLGQVPEVPPPITIC